MNHRRSWPGLCFQSLKGDLIGMDLDFMEFLDSAGEIVELGYDMATLDRRGHSIEGQDQVFEVMPKFAGGVEIGRVCFLVDQPDT